MLAKHASSAAGTSAGPRAQRTGGARAARLATPRAIPTPNTDVIAAADEARLERMRTCFRMADIDGNGAIDKRELRALLETVEGGTTYLFAWEGMFPEAKLDAIFEKYDKDKSGTITIDEFSQLVYDGLLLEGTLADYEAAFNAVDKSGNGSIGATELSEMFKQLGQPISQDKLVDIFMKYDVDSSGQIEFPEFIEMFRDSLLDLAQINAWVSGRAAAGAAGGGAAGGGEGGGETTLLKANQLDVAAAGLLETVEGQVSVIFSEAELDEVLEKNKDRLVVLFGGVTWCRPCKGVSKPYERMADLYDSSVFLKLYGNANVQCKRLFQRLKIRSTPAYILFRGGEVVGQGSGGNKERLEALIRGHLTAEELEGKPAIYEGEGAATAAV